MSAYHEDGFFFSSCRSVQFTTDWEYGQIYYSTAK